MHEMKAARSNGVQQFDFYTSAKMGGAMKAILDQNGNVIKEIEEDSSIVNFDLNSNTEPSLDMGNMRKKEKPKSKWRKQSVMGLIVGVLSLAIAILAYYYPLGESDLYLIIDNAEAFGWAYEDVDINGISNFEEAKIVMTTDSLYFNNISVHKYLEEGVKTKVEAKIKILNSGKKAAKGIDLLINWPADVGAFVFGSDAWNYGSDVKQEKYVFWFNDNDLSVKRHSSSDVIGLLTMDFPIKPEKYVINYDISTGKQTIHRSINLEVILREIEGAYIVNADGLLSFQRRNYNDALSFFEAAIELNSSSSTLYFNKGTTLVMLGRYSDAIKAYDISFSLAPNDTITKNEPEFYAELAAGYMTAESPAKALVMIERALLISPENERYINYLEFVKKAQTGK